MEARFRRPAAPLDAFVERFWYFGGYAAPYSRERALPTGTVELVFNLGDARMRVFRDDADFTGQHFRDAVVCGPQSGYFVLDTSTPANVAGVHFRPGGATPFLGVPATDCTDRHVELADIWGSAGAHDLCERVRAARSPEAMFDLVERALLARLRRPLLMHPAVEHGLRALNRAPEIARIAEVQHDSGYSSKRFIGLFAEAVGLTPKLYCRIQRFQAAIGRAARGGPIEWAMVAADGGFYDQPHLNREFRNFAGVTPGAYRPVAPDRPSHIAIE
jgi:AraC-like DNA-binding protein